MNMQKANWHIYIFTFNVCRLYLNGFNIKEHKNWNYKFKDFEEKHKRPKFVFFARRCVKLSIISEYSQHFKILLFIWNHLSQSLLSWVHVITLEFYFSVFFYFQFPNYCKDSMARTEQYFKAMQQCFIVTWRNNCVLQTQLSSCKSIKLFYGL